MTTAKIGAIGENDVMLIFKAVGVDVFPTNSRQEAADTLSKLAKEGYAVIFVTESVALMIDAEIKKHASKMLPSIVVVPGLKERNNYALEKLRQSIIKAVGADVMKDK